MTSTETLAHYDPNRKTIVAADACDYGVGAVLLQANQDGDRRPVYYASRSLSETEQRYAMIEKEALASTWACEKFSDYVLGMQFTLETDHKPLVPLLASKDLSSMPPRILRFRLRMMRFAPTVVHVQGKDQVTADALSRAPVDKPSPSDISFIEEVEQFASFTVKYLPATEVRLRQICRAQDEDAVCTEVKSYCKNGWPGYMPQQPLLRPYWEKRNHLTLKNELRDSSSPTARGTGAAAPRPPWCHQVPSSGHAECMVATKQQTDRGNVQSLPHLRCTPSRTQRTASPIIFPITCLGKSRHRSI